MGWLSKLLGGGQSSSLDEFKSRKAIVIDVRTPGEFKAGHVKGSRNIPLQSISNRKKEILNLKKPIVLCCASGGRSGQATRILKREGVDCMNGGSWIKVDQVFG